MFHFLRLLIQLVLAPQNGWEDISGDRMLSNGLLRRGFVPLAILSSLSVFISCLYHSDLSAVTLIQHAIVMFTAFFIAIFIAEFFFSLFFINDIETAVDPMKVHTYIVFALSTMMFMTLLMNLVPFSPVLVLLPLYTIVVMRMSTDYLKIIPDRVGHFMMLSIFTIFLPPFLIIFLFRVLLG